MNASQTATTYCDGCGQPAHCHPNDSSLVVALKRCSRCHQAFYHNVECQKKHYRQHKASCRRQKQRPADDDDLEIVQGPGRGRCLMAKRALPANYRIGSSSSISNSFYGFRPRVLPVLNRSHRTSRCALCFGRLDSSSAVTTAFNPQQSSCPVLVCSAVCRRAADEWQLPREVACIQKLYSQNKAPPTLLPTALLIFRILWAAASPNRHDNDDVPLEKLHTTLQTHPSLEQSVEAIIHAKAVVQTVLALVSTLDKSSLIKDQMLALAPTIPSLIRVIDYNAFTIVDKEEALGTGLYATLACRINHACGRPNTVQSFAGGQRGQPPHLLLHLTRPVAPHEEICIQYLPDDNKNRQERRSQLYQQYKFWCKCDVCQSGA